MPLFRNFVTIRTADGPMPMYLVGPGGGVGPSLETAGDVRLIERPAILIIPDELGLHLFDCDIADRFANDGYYAAVPDLFHRSPAAFSETDVQTRRQSLTDAQVKTDVEAAIAYLRTQPYVVWEKLGIVGFGLGGRAASMMASHSALGIAASFSSRQTHHLDGASGGQCPVLTFEDDASVLQQSPASDDAWARLLASFHKYLPRTEEAGKGTLLRDDQIGGHGRGH